MRDASSPELNEADSSINDRKFPSSPKKLGLLPMAIITFYVVSGGPFGIEDIVRAGGPFYALIGFSLLFVWAVPEILISAELSTALPEASGSVAWVTTAFGDFWGFQKGWLSWLSGVTDNALYPILFLDTLLALLDNDEAIGKLARWMFIFIITAVLTLINYRGLEVVGNTSIMICCFSMLPFIIFSILGAFKVRPSRWFVGPPDGISGINWRLFLNTFFWNINYWESAAAFSGDVLNPGVNFPRSMLLALLLVFLLTFVPVLVGTGATSTPYTAWTDGSFTRLASEIVGPWLGIWMVLSSAVSNVGMFEAEMSTDAFQVRVGYEAGVKEKL